MDEELSGALARYNDALEVERLARETARGIRDEIHGMLTLRGIEYMEGGDRLTDADVRRLYWEESGIHVKAIGQAIGVMESEVYLFAGSGELTIRCVHSGCRNTKTVVAANRSDHQRWRHRWRCDPCEARDAAERAVRDAERAAWEHRHAHMLRALRDLEIVQERRVRVIIDAKDPGDGSLIWDEHLVPVDD